MTLNATSTTPDNTTLNPFKTGDVLVGSWGYEQTNVDFYEVQAVTAKSVTVRKLLADKTAQDAQQFTDRGTVVPRPGVFDPSAKARRCLVKNPAGQAPSITVDRVYVTAWNGKPQNWTAYA